MKDAAHEPDGCDDCGRQETVTYRCTSCSYSFDVPGEYYYFPQGRGHFHIPDNDERFKTLLFDHQRSHPQPTAFLPEKKGSEQ